jgi:hypothetical protein
MGGPPICVARSWQQTGPICAPQLAGARGPLGADKADLSLRSPLALHMPSWTILSFPGTTCYGCSSGVPGGEASQVRPCPLHTRLSDMKPRADNAHRRNATSRKVISEQLRGLHLQRIGGRRAAGQPGPCRHARRHPSATDDHHQQFAGADECDRSHGATAAPARPWPRPWAMFAARVAAMPTPSSHHARAGTGTLRRAESSSTIELA